jgi:hypothetical protein
MGSAEIIDINCPRENAAFEMHNIKNKNTKNSLYVQPRPTIK